MTNFLDNWHHSLPYSHLITKTFQLQSTININNNLSIHSVSVLSLFAIGDMARCGAVRGAWRGVQSRIRIGVP